MSVKAYKIKNQKTGLYSTGGSIPRWTAKGKTWSSLGPLKNHLGLVLDNNRAHRFAYDTRDWVIIELELVETRWLTVAEAVADIQAKRIKRADAQKRANERYKQEAIEREFKRLKRELGK